MRAYEDDARAGWNAADQSKLIHPSLTSESQTHGDDSVLAFWKRAIAVRKAHDVLTYGDFEMRMEPDERVMAYVRTMGGARARVVLNFMAEVVEVPLDEGGLGLPLGDGHGRCALVLCNYPKAEGSGSRMETGERKTLALRGYEARVYVQTGMDLAN